MNKVNVFPIPCLNSFFTLNNNDPKRKVTNLLVFLFLDFGFRVKKLLQFLSDPTFGPVFEDQKKGYVPF
jgi:hypothetical protein